MSLPPPPAELAHLAQLLGAEGLFTLIEAHGGTRLYIPRTPPADGPLVRLVGAQAAAALAEAWGGEELPVPLARRWQVHVLRSRGFSVPAICRALTITDATVRRVLADDRARTEQMELGL